MESSKLGGMLLQYPRWFLPTPGSEAVLADAAARLAGIPATVALRNVSWCDAARHTARTPDLLRRFGLTHAMVDGPQGVGSGVPRIAATTTTTHLASPHRWRQATDLRWARQ